MEMLGMPIEQRNATIGGEMVMRVGIPHRGGGLAFHAFENEFPAMVSANAFWNPEKNCFSFPEYTNLSELDFALDSAGYTAISMWKKKGTQRGMAGVFPWTAAEYIEFANRTGCAWWSQPDLCCEPEIASSRAEIDYRINATATLLEVCLRQLYHWQNELAKQGWSATMIENELKPPVPVIQGWSADDYLRSLDLLTQVWERWQPWLAAPSLIGVGSVCRRTLKDSKHGLYAVIAALEGRLPTGSSAHLFGVKGPALSELKMHSWISSADSMAYDFGARVKARKSGQSNSIAHRSEEMSRWMSSAAQRMKPAAGDQFRLGLFA